MAEQKEMFNSFDLNKDGFLSLKELNEFMKEYYPELIELLECMLVDIEIVDDTIDFPNFKILMALIELMVVYKQIDKDGDGFISRDELKTFLETNTFKKYIDEEINLIIATVDHDFVGDGDGQINWEEFKKLILPSA